MLASLTVCRGVGQWGCVRVRCTVGTERTHFPPRLSLAPSGPTRPSNTSIYEPKYMKIFYICCTAKNGSADLSVIYFYHFRNLIFILEKCIANSTVINVHTNSLPSMRVCCMIMQPGLMCQYSFSCRLRYFLDQVVYL